MELNKRPGNRWLLQPFAGSILVIGSQKAPCLFHRLMQRWLLGFVWTKLGDKTALCQSEESRAA